MIACEFGYRLVEIAGKGSYGTVYHAKCKHTGESFALKEARIPKDDDENEGFDSSLLKEISILSDLRGLYNIVELREVCYNPYKDKYYMALEYFPYTLHTMDRKLINKDSIKLIMYQLLNGTHQLHSRGLMHRDLKPFNILINPSTMYLAIGDFGSCTDSMEYHHEEQSKKTIPDRSAGTTYFRAPELLYEKGVFGKECDLWSIGLVMAWLVKKEFFWWSFVPRQFIFARHFNEDELDQSGMDLLLRLLCFDKSLRISAKDAMEHPYFESIDKKVRYDSLDFEEG